jgi:hypothetical protein
MAVHHRSMMSAISALETEAAPDRVWEESNLSE